MNELVHKEEKLEALKKRGEEMLAQVQALEVVDESGRAIAAELREKARLYIKGIKDDWKGEDGEVTVAFRLYKSLLARVDKAIEFPEKVMGIAESKMSAYQLEEDRKHREAQAKIDAEIRSKEDAERERLLKLAVKQAENGKAEKAEETLQRAEEVFMPAPVLPSLDKRVVTDAGGTSSRKDFDLAIVNSHEVILAIAAGKIPFGVARHDVAKNEIRITGSSLKDFAKLNQVGDTLPTVPGCRLAWAYKFSGRSK
jgi:hypothetical protein